MIPMFCGYLSNQELSYDSYEEESYPNLKNLPANWCFYSPPPQMEVIKKNESNIQNLPQKLVMIVASHKVGLTSPYLGQVTV